jgi:hypothetical protein
MGMEAITLVHTEIDEHLMAMSNVNLEAWFAACGLSVHVIANCSDPECPDCLTLPPAQEAA